MPVTGLLWRRCVGMDEITDAVFRDQPADFAAPEPPASLLPLLTLEEAQDAIEVLRYYGTESNWYGDTATRLARELAARVPSRD